MAATIFDLNFNKRDADSVLRILVYANLYSPDDIQFTGYIIVDGVTRQTCTANIVLDNQSSQGQIPLSPFAFLTGLAAGSHNVQFVMENREVDNVSLTVQAGATIEITELRQGGR